MAIVVRNGRKSVDPTIGVRPTNEEERKGLRSITAKDMAVDTHQLPQLEEGSNKRVAWRIGRRGPDFIIHFYAPGAPIRDSFRENLARIFEKILGTTDRIEASKVDTHEFERYPFMWAIRGVDWAINPVAYREVREKFVLSLLEELENA